MLEPHHKPARGRLKVFLGYALGVWESISMLEEVQRRWGLGLDVVVGAVRPEISNWALVNNFEMMPPLLVEGVPVLDVPAVMNRRPTMCVVDGLAYDNPAGSRNAHRWQDADELLAAGINVIASVNLRYIDDQRHVVEKITGQKVDQTVPRTFVDMADEIVIVDPFEHELSALRRMADLVAYVGSPVGKPMEFHSCFISYSHMDKAFAEGLHDTLKGRGIRSWIDDHQLRPGDDIYDQVDRGIRMWDKMLLCCSEASLKSWWVDNEIGTALEKEVRLTQERGEKVQAIIPLNLDGSMFRDDWKSGYRAQIRRRLAADFTGWEQNNEKFQRGVENVIRALRADEGSREQPPQSRL